MYWFFPFLLMVLTFVPNDLLWNILIINFLVSFIIYASIKSLLLEFKKVFPSEIFENSFDLNTITNVSTPFFHLHPTWKSSFWPTILTTATILISGSLLESISGIFAEGCHSFVYFQRKLGPLNHWSILCLLFPIISLDAWSAGLPLDATYCHWPTLECFLMTLILFTIYALNLSDSFCSYPGTTWLLVRKCSLSCQCCTEVLLEWDLISLQIM